MEYALIDSRDVNACKRFEELLIVLSLLDFCSGVKLSSWTLFLQVSCIWLDSRYIFMRLSTNTLGKISITQVVSDPEVDSRLVPRAVIRVAGVFNDRANP